jgi:hypothetical protein
MSFGSRSQRSHRRLLSLRKHDRGGRLVTAAGTLGRRKKHIRPEGF